MFIAGTQIFTNSGWKRIADVSGNDKVLVKNFLGDAEFIQPFALKKKQYEGQIVKIGAKDWAFSVTPDHEIVYETFNVESFTMHSVPAGEMQAKTHYKLQRKFRYMFPEEPKKEYINIRDEFGMRTVTVSNQDWYRLVGFILTRGFIRTKPGRPMVFIFLEEGRMQEEIAVLGDILDRIGLGWHVQYSERTRPKVVISSRNSLAVRLRTRLGSTTRKSMYLPDKMVYSSSKELIKLLIDTIIDTSIKPDTQRTDHYQLATTNLDLIHSLELIGTLGGYGMRHNLRVEAGTTTLHGETKKDSYTLHISDPVALYSPRYVKKSVYSGYVYGIELFGGQIYVKEKLNPIWVNPK